LKQKSSKKSLFKSSVKLPEEDADDLIGLSVGGGVHLKETERSKKVLVTRNTAHKFN
jgi:hypothetical protein